MVDKKLEETHFIDAVKLPKDRKSLEALVSAANENITIWEGGFFIPAAFVALGLSLLGLAYQNLLIGRMLTVAILGGLALFLFFIFLRTMLRRQVPFFVITPDGLETSVFKTPVPWRGIEDFQINSSKTNAMNIAVGMEFVITPRFLPEENETSRGGSYYDKEKRKLMISGFNFRLDTNRDRLIDQIETYRTAALARHKLQMKDFK